MDSFNQKGKQKEVAESMKETLPMLERDPKQVLSTRRMYATMKKGRGKL